MGNSTRRKNFQAGSSLHAVIIIVLFISLMATLGIVFYQNFIAGKPAAVQTQKPAEVMTTITRIAFNSDIYSLDYPKEWKSITTKSDEQANGGSVTKITNPEGTVAATFTISGAGMSGACDVNDGLKISYYTIKDIPVGSLTDVPVYLVQAIVDNPGGGYQYIIGLTPDSGATHAVVGDSHCNVRSVGTASFLVLDGQKVVKPTILTSITFPKLSKAEDGSIKDMRQIKDMMDTDDYKAAVEVLESARKE